MSPLTLTIPSVGAAGPGYATQINQAFTDVAAYVNTGLAGLATANTFSADQTFTAKLKPQGTGTNSVNIGNNAAANVSAASAIGIGITAIASSASAIAIGSTSTASGTFGIAIGASSQATGTSNPVAVGRNSKAIGTQSTALGSSAAANAASSVVVGFGASCANTESGAVVVGQGAAAGGNVFTDGVTTNGSPTITSATAWFTDIDVGKTISGTGIPGGTTIVSVDRTNFTTATMSANATADATGVTITLGRSPQGENVAVGQLAHATEWRATVVGYSAFAALSATALGRGARAQGSHDVAIGRGSWTPGGARSGHNVAIRSQPTSGNETHLWIGSCHTHKFNDPVNDTAYNNVPSTSPIVIHGFDAYDDTAAPTNNVAGGPLVLAAGRGTGTAIGGSVKLQVAPASGVSSNTQNTLVNVVECGVIGTASALGFFGATPVVKPTGVAVSAAAIHAALVSLGLIAA